MNNEKYSLFYKKSIYNKVEKGYNIVKDVVNAIILK